MRYGFWVAMMLRRRVLPFLLVAIAVSSVWRFLRSGRNSVLIIVVTPTAPDPKRIPDMTRLSQTLMHVENLKWIVVEQGSRTADPVNRLLQRSGVDYVYINAEQPASASTKGWAQRNAALTYIREMYTSDHEPAVVYFADDDNAYDLRLFNEYIRKVKSIGFWAVGFSGAAKVEAPRVKKKKLVGWDVVFAKERKYATDMAGFAIGLDLILKSRATFHRMCEIPETCFLEQLPIDPNNIQIFGWDRVPRDLVVWHTRTSAGDLQGDTYGYVFENDTTDIFTKWSNRFWRLYQLSGFGPTFRIDN